MNIFKRIKNLWLLSAYTPREVIQKQIEDHLEFSNHPGFFVSSSTPSMQSKPDGKAEFLSFLSEDEMNAFIKEEEMGWKKVFNPIRELFKKNEQ